MMVLMTSIKDFALYDSQVDRLKQSLGKSKFISLGDEVVATYTILGLVHKSSYKNIQRRKLSMEVAKQDEAKYMRCLNRLMHGSCGCYKPANHCHMTQPEANEATSLYVDHLLTDKLAGLKKLRDGYLGINSYAQAIKKSL